MVTDPIFYRLFETSPETFFLVLGMTPDKAREMAARYQYEALEFKETSHRVDGVFRPREPGLDLYFVEVQFYYKLPRLSREEIPCCRSTIFARRGYIRKPGKRA